MDLFNIICGVCSIIVLLVSLFTAGTVVRISNHIGNVKNVIKGSTITDYTGGSIQVNGKE